MNGIPMFRKQAGNVFLSLLASVAYLFLGLILLALAYFGFCEARKAYWDHQVMQLCEKDGGVRVYEKEKISPELYKQLGGQQGEIPIYSKSSAAIDAPYFAEETTVYLHERNPQVRRSETRYKKRKDNKTLATYVYYARVGGDFPTFAHPSSHGCLFPKDGLTKQFIQIEGEPK